MTNLDQHFHDTAQIAEIRLLSGAVAQFITTHSHLKPLMRVRRQGEATFGPVQEVDINVALIADCG